MKPINKTWTMIICCIFLYGFAPMACAGVETIMFIKGVEGESQNGMHPGWIDVLSIEWNLDASATADKRGSGGEISDVKITIAADAASPYLALAAMQAKSFPAVDFDFVNDSGEVVRTLRLSDVNIKTLESSTRDGIPPYETLTMNYTKVEWVGYPVDREQAPNVFIWTRTGGN